MRRPEFLGSLVRRSANRIGIDVHRYRPEATLHGRLASMLAFHSVDVVLDVGANVGQFAQALRAAGFGGRIVSFEPLSEAHAQLERQADARWLVAPRAAIGAEEGEVEINVSRNSYSSSVLDLLPAHLDAAPDSAYVGSERVGLTRLDIASRPYLQDGDRPFVKIDTQGYEAAVLDGAAEILQRASGLHLELSMVPLYDGQPLHDEIIERLRDTGFSIWGVWSGIHDPESGRMLQFDATLFRTDR